MRYRTIAGRAVSEIGMGCWQIGGEWGEVDEETALSCLSTARSSGVTMFDTADIYGGGRSERILGEFLAAQKEPVFVATKLGRAASPGWPRNFTAAAMRRHVEGSLSRLGVDSLDLLQLHCVPADVMAEGAVFDTLRELREQGLIRAFGASVETVEEAFLCLEQEGLASLQVIFNLFRQTPAAELFGAAQRREVALIIRLPLASGLLSGRFGADTTFPADDHRSFNRDGDAFHVGETFAGLPFERGVELVERLRAHCPEGMTMAQFAQRWILDHPAVTTVITGVSRPDQARRNATVSDLPALPASLHAELGEFFAKDVQHLIRGPV